MRNIWSKIQINCIFCSNIIVIFEKKGFFQTREKTEGAFLKNADILKNL